MAGKDFGGLDFSEIFKDLNKLADQVTKNAEGIEQAAGDAGKQVGDSFVDGIEQGFEDAASRIAASSLKINKTFKDLAKKLTNQKDIFNISLGGKNIVLDIDFSDVDIDSADFKKQVDNAFEKLKIDNAIEFDSKTVEKQFKNMLSLYLKYGDKLSKLQNQAIKLNKPESVKANAQEQLAIIDGLKEIQRVLDKTSNMSISLPHLYSDNTKDLRTIIATIDMIQKGEEKVGRQRDTNTEKIKRENKELKERNRLLEEQVGPIEEGELPPARKPRARKPKVETPVATGTGDSALQQLKRDAEAASKAFEEAHNKLSDIIKAEEELDWQLTSRGFVDYGKKYRNTATMKKQEVDNLRRSFTKKSDHKDNVQTIEGVIQNLIDNDALGANGVFSSPKDLSEFTDYKFAVDTGATNKVLNSLLNSLVNKLQREMLETMDTYKSWGDIQSRDNTDADSLIEERRRLAEEHAAAAKAYNDAAEMKEAAYKRLSEAENSVPQSQTSNNKALEEQNAKLAERNRLIDEYLEAQRKRYAIESKYGSRFKEDITLEDYNEWTAAMEVGRKLTMRPDGGEIIEEANERILNEFKEFGVQFDNLRQELGDPNNWLDKYTILADQIRHGALTAAEAVAKLREEMSKPADAPNVTAGYDSPAREKPPEMGKWKKAKFFSYGRKDGKNQAIAREGRTDGNYNYFKDEINKQWQVIDKVTGLSTGQYYSSFKKAQEDTYSEQMQEALSKLTYNTKAAQMAMQAIREAEANAGLSSDGMQVEVAKERKKIVEEIANIESKADEQSIVAEQTELDIAEEELRVEKEITNKSKYKFARTFGDKSGKFRVSKIEGTQMTMDDIIPNGAEDSAIQIETEANAMDKVDESAKNAAESKKKFAKANKEVAASVSPSVKGLKTEVDAIEDVGEVAGKTVKTISDGARNAAENMNFSTRDYEKLYEEMEAFAEQRKAENGYDLSRVSVNTDAHGNPLGATISYYKKATKETITEVFKIDSAAQEAEDGVNRLVLSSRRATAGIADFEKATLQAINRQDQLIAQKNKTISSLSAVLDPNSNRSLAGTDYEEEANRRIQAIKDEVAKLDQVDSAGERIILPEKDFLAIKRRIAELTQDARDFINASKNAEYAPTQLESHSVSSGNKYRQDQLNAKINEWKRAGIYVGDLKAKAEELAKSVTKITDHEGLRKYLEGLKEARALATLAIQDKRSEEERQAKLNDEYKEYIKLIEKRDAIEAKMIGLDPEKNRDELAALKAEYDAIDNEWNTKYGNFLEREDVQNHFTVDELSYADDVARRKMAVKEGKISDKKRLEDEAAAQKKVNDAYAEYIRLVQERGRASVRLAGLDPEKNKAEIDEITAYIDGIDNKLNETYGDLLSNHIAQATLTLEDFMKYYDKWQQKLAEKEAQVADKARQKEEKPYRDYGKTTANSAVRKRDRLQGEVDALGVTNPEILAKMDVYNAKVQKILDLRTQFNNNPDAAKDPELVKQFQTLAAEADRVYKGIKAVIDEEQRMAQLSAEQGFEPVELSAGQMYDLENTMIAHAKATAQGRVEIKGWNADHTKMNYTVTNSKGVVEEMTMALGQGRNTMYQYRTATKETGTLIQQVFKGIKTKAKELLSFVIGGGSVYKVIELLRQGIQYVRDIDLALTELKKVTDETEESYDKFLETAAKTADKVGSTIQKVVSSTADWARLNI